MSVYPFEPDEWRIGDRAYCVEGTKNGLEVGRVYQVVGVKKIRGLMRSGLTLEGIEVSPPYAAFSSGRFICLRGHGYLRQIERARNYRFGDLWPHRRGRQP